MNLGFFTMPLHPPGSDISKTIVDDTDQIVKLDWLGYSEAWIGEHFTFEWENIPSPDLFIAQASPLTSRIKLGTGVTCLPNHNPAMLAHRIAQLDHQTGGRLLWGIGSSSTPGDYELFGFNPEEDDRRSFTLESVEAVLKIWMDPTPGEYTNGVWKYVIPEPVDKVGLRLHLKPLQDPHPPIAVGGVSPKSETLKFAGQKGWIPISINLVPTASLIGHWEAYAEGASRSQLVPDRSKWRIAREIYVADTTKKARKEAMEGTIARDYKDYWFNLLDWSNSLDRFKLDVNMPDSDLTLDYLMDNVWIVGSPDEVAEKLATLYEDTGGFGTILAMGHEWEPRQQWIESMSLLADTVMPKLAKL